MIMVWPVIMETWRQLTASGLDPSGAPAGLAREDILKLLELGAYPRT